MNDISIIEALGVSLLGMCVVFAVLLILMAVIYIMTAATKKNRAAEAAEPQPVAAVAAPVSAPAAKAEPARGSCGDVSLFAVPDRTAAMIMAIVADELDAPLNELRFISIKEVEDGSK